MEEIKRLKKLQDSGPQKDLYEDAETLHEFQRNFEDFELQAGRVVENAEEAKSIWKVPMNSVFFSVFSFKNELLEIFL